MQQKTLTVAEIADIVGGQVVGDADIKIDRVASLDQATPHDISFLSNPKLEQQLNTTQAGCVLLSDGYAKANHSNEKSLTYVLCEDPYLGFAKVAQVLDNTPLPANEISASASIHSSVVLQEGVTIASGAVIEKDCKIGSNVSIGANAYLGEGVVLGDNTIVYANVSIHHRVTVGSHCIFHSGVVIGCDGFGYANEAGNWIKIPQTGGVIIHDRVEIGANSCVDRGALNDTIIGAGVKIDNLCHVAHNVEIGENTAMAACSGIAGSTKVGKSCTFSGRSSLIGHLNIADGTHVTAGTLISKSNETAGIFSSGTGAQENKIWRKNVARFKQLDDMAKKIRQLEKKLSDL